MDKLFFVYYIDFPLELESLLISDKFLSMTKEGVKNLHGGKFPRVCIRIRGVTNTIDKDRSRQVENLLIKLKASGRIVEFTS